MHFFVDTSALNKRYLPEAGAAWVRSWIRPVSGNVIIISDLAAVEAFSAYARLLREGRLSPTRHVRLQSLLLLHIEHEYLAIPADNMVLTRARKLIDLYPLRALDSIQLASAHRASDILGELVTFITADNNLRNAAHGEGFAVDDPNTHLS